MNKKLLINITDIPEKRNLLTFIVKEGYDFIEATDEEDLSFKMKLLKDDLSIYIHQLNYNDYAKEFTILSRIISRGLKTILVIDEYSKSIIDDATVAGISDIVVMPIKEEIFINKLQMVLLKDDNKDEKNIDIEKALIMKQFNNENIITINEEIARANRGGYSIALVLVEITNIDKDELTRYEAGIREALRTTDTIMMISDYAFLLICPFTDKGSVVEVENKTRQVFNTQYKSYQRKAALYLYGVTYPQDGTNADKLVDRLNLGIHNSIIIGNMRGTFNEIGSEKIKKYREMLRRI